MSYWFSRLFKFWMTRVSRYLLMITNKVFTCAKKVYYIGSEGPNTQYSNINICFGKIQHLVFLSQMTELKSVDYLQIFLSPPKLFIFLYLLAFLSCPVTLYTSMNSAHSVFHVCSSIRSFPSSVRPSHSAR